MSGFDLKYFPAQAIRLEVSAKVADFTAENGKMFAVTPSGTLNVQLPAPSSSFHCVVKDLSGDLDTNTLNLVRNGVENIDGQAANFQMKSGYQSITIISDGVDWYII